MDSRQSLNDKIVLIKRCLISDERGWFLKVITGKEDELPDYTGEVYITSATPGQSKGGHYHEIAKEWFTLLTGKATLRLKDIDTGEEMTLNLDVSNPVTIFVPPRVAHRFDNDYNDDFILLAYTDLHYKPEDTIAYLF